jgi:hypothetical protein
MLGVVTSHPRFYQNAVEELKKRGEKFQSFGLNDVIPDEVDLVITSLEERDKISFPNVVTAKTGADAVREAIFQTGHLKKTYNTILVGIDPGKSTGIVGVGEGSIIYENIARSPKDVVPSIKKIKERFSPEKVLIKIGAAGGAYRNQIIADIQERLNYQIEIVSEVLTTQPKAVSRRMGVHKDILAARKIADKKGKLLTRKVEIKTTPGEIKNAQRESRKESEHITISKKLAESVVKGEIDMKEAIRLQKKGEDEDLHPS